MNQVQEPEQEKERLYTAKEFFEEIPPGKAVPIENLAKKTGLYIGDNDFILPELNLYCDVDTCEGFRLFEPKESRKLFAEQWNDLFVEYICKNCGKRIKTYALLAFLNKDRKGGKLYKYGELPEFGPPTPSRVVTVLGAERDYYFKGRRVENQGLGIAAFAYYRRVVENQKNKIFDEIIRTVKKVDANNTALLVDLENAKKETQFTKAVDSIKHGIPQALLIDGHNPLTLLHGALSDGLHAKTDEECLEFATSIRIILTDLVERMANALKDSAELKTAVSRILQKRDSSTPAEPNKRSQEKDIPQGSSSSEKGSSIITPQAQA
jgi:hypothetical protein